MIQKSRELKLPAFFVRPGTLFIVYCIQIFTLSVPVCVLIEALILDYSIQIYTLSVPPCVQGHFLSSIIFKPKPFLFRVSWGTFSRLLYSINSICSMCLEAPILVYCIQILNFTVHYLTHFLSKIHFLSNITFKN